MWWLVFAGVVVVAALVSVFVVRSRKPQEVDDPLLVTGLALLAGGAATLVTLGLIMIVPILLGLAMVLGARRGLSH